MAKPPPNFRWSVGEHRSIHSQGSMHATAAGSTGCLLRRLPDAPHDWRTRPVIVSSRSARASAHRDRATAEPRLHSPVGSTAVDDRRIVPLTRRSRHAHLPPPVKRTHRSSSPPVWVHSRATSNRDAARTLARRRASSRRLPSPRPIRVSRRPARATPVGSQKSQRFAQ